MPSSSGATLGGTQGARMAEYTLAISDAEVERYMLMAERSRQTDGRHWQRAGVVPGAVVADVGCGPAAFSAVLASVVGPTGRVIGVERDPQALAAARRVVATAGVGNVELRSGDAADTGLPAGSVDVVVMRHVLAHNGPDEQRIVDHVAGLVRPGGSVFLVDVDGTAVRMLDADADLDDLDTKYLELHRRRGNDLQTGLRLGRLLRRAGLTVVLHEGTYDIISVPPGVRPPSWAACAAMLDEGVASPEDVRRWEAAFDRMDVAEPRLTAFLPQFVAIGASPA
jgi:SAM-dependent methyltransferase